ncbi:hypothetical protein BGZ73_009256 [Actinomortierella ambigua]|nr:hypothetical protein BGZ73_009256 [Actinomortierella ambigua]
MSPRLNESKVEESGSNGVTLTSTASDYVVGRSGGGIIHDFVVPFDDVPVEHEPRRSRFCQDSLQMVVGIWYAFCHDFAQPFLGIPIALPDAESNLVHDADVEHGFSNPILAPLRLHR